MTYRIRTVSEMTGIPRNTLIAWERRYGVIKPSRHDNGYRSYSDEDVARLLQIKNAQKAGLKVSEAFELLRRNDGVSAAAADSHVHRPPSQGEFLGLREELTSALVGYRKDEAERILSRLISVPFTTRLDEIYFPVLVEIGERWEQGRISIAQEHYATSILRTHLASILVGIGPSSPSAPHAACTTFPGELHEMAALALSIQLSLAGYRVSYLGPNLPADELSGFVKQQRPILVCVSVIVPVSADSALYYARTVAQALPPSGTLVLGGHCLAQLPPLDLPQVRVEPSWWRGSSSLPLPGALIPAPRPV